MPGKPDKESSLRGFSLRVSTAHFYGLLQADLIEPNVLQHLREHHVVEATPTRLLVTPKPEQPELTGT